MKRRSRAERTRRLILIAATLLLTLGTAGLAQDLSSQVQLRLEMFVVTVDNGQERFTPSITAREGQVVEYRILAVSHATEPLQAGTVTVTVPIPADTTYQVNSAVPVSEAVLVEFRALDGEYMAPPVFIETDGNRRSAPPTEYSGIRWTLLDVFQPGEEREFSFRVTVD